MEANKMGNQMTCGELINKLSKFPKDKPVKIIAMGSEYEKDFPDTEDIGEIDYSYIFEDEYDEEGEPILEENNEYVGIFTKEYCDDLLMNGV